MTLLSRNIISLSLQLGLQACNIIRQASIDKNLKKYQKAHDDHVTQADYKVQSMLIKGFKMHFPQLKIIGQQTQQFKGQIDFDYSKLKSNILPDHIKINSSQPLRECCLWIDPIDCTKGFIEGSFQDVTVLIGMSTNNHPSIGVIGVPFRKIGQNRVYSPQLIFGSVEDKKAYLFTNNKYEQLMKKTNNKEKLTVTTSISRSNQMQQKYVKYLNANHILAGGSGRKIALVIKGQADMMAYVGAHTCKWDSCAGQSIIKAMGGNFTTPTGKSISYNPEDSLQNSQGIFCSFDKQIHKKSIQFVRMQKQKV